MSEGGKQTTFEQDLARLEEIVTKLEDGELTLDDSLALFEEGQAVLGRCREKLEKAHVRVHKLLENGGTEQIDPESPGR